MSSSAHRRSRPSWTRPAASRRPPRAPRGCARCSPRRCATAARSSPSRARATTSPVEVAFAAQDGLLLAATPADAGLRADPEAAGEREWLLVAATVAALVELACPGRPAAAADLALRAGESAGGLLLAFPARRRARASSPSSRPDVFASRSRGIDRLRAARPRAPARRARGGRAARADRRGPPAAGRRGRGAARPPTSRASSARRRCSRCSAPAPAPPCARTRTPIRGAGWRGGSSSASTGWASGAATTPTSPTSRAASRATTARSRRRPARRCSTPGLLAEKPSVGQRHVFLNPRRARDIRAFIETRRGPSGAAAAATMRGCAPCRSPGRSPRPSRPSRRPSPR